MALRRDMEQVLRAMQRITDRQRTLAIHGVLVSDERLQIEILDPGQVSSVEGRVLIHGRDEATGKNHLMLEGTDGRVQGDRSNAYWSPGSTSLNGALTGTSLT